jgi:predicted ribosome quality control (RQC) complex YloA/Tae2 family protein
VSALARTPRAPERPPALAQYLKAHLEGARLREAGLRGADRQLALHFEARDGSRTVLVLALMGPRSNLYVLERGEVLTRSARPLAKTRRDLVIGEPFRDPEPRPARVPENRFEGFGEEELLRAIEAEYAAREDREQEDRLRQRLTQAFRKQRAALGRKERSLERDAGAAEEAPRLERQGELLKANLKRARAGSTELVAEDFETGESVTVELDPKLSGSENMEQLFRRARKAMKKGVRAAQDLEALRERAEALAGLESELEALPDDDEALRAFAEGPEVRRLLDRYYPKPAAPGEERKPKKVWKLGKRELPTRLVPKRYRASGDLEIWVGKNDEGNDLLTTRLARGRDLFFHLEGSPGSHVVLRLDKGEPPQEALLEAAELAVQFSKQKNAGRAPVHVAEIKDISKPRGAKPGLVYVHRGRTLQLRRDPARLKRVLSARIDD